MIFTEIINAGPVGRIMLESYFKHHPKTDITVYGTPVDFELLGEIKTHGYIRLIDVGTDETIMAAFKNGHQGTAMIFARAWKENMGQYLIHIDSDVYFKKESISLLTDSLDEGYDIVGSRRCYEKNPGGAIMKPGTPDAISTYFTGWHKEKLNANAYSNDEFIRMWQGAYNPLGFPVLDFADPICFAMLNNGAKIKFIDSNLIGGQDENGSKVNNYKNNMHFDVGSHLVHFGGVGSGYAYYNKLSNPEASYAQWSLGRWSLFNNFFYHKDIQYTAPCIINEQGRWVNGNYNDEIYAYTINAISDVPIYRRIKNN